VSIEDEQTTEPNGDLLPDDLQPGLADHDEYAFPNNNRRRIPAFLYVALAALLILAYVAFNGHPAVNNGLLWAAGLLGLFAAYSYVAGWDLLVDERDALVAAVGAVGFSVGHASAQMGWRGLWSRPTWRVLLYSADEPPSKRGFVLVDGTDGEVLDAFVEENPEDWSEFSESTRAEATPAKATTDD